MSTTAPAIHHRTYDPLVGYSKDHCEIPGLQTWPVGRRLKDAGLRVMVLGGSTTMWPLSVAMPNDDLLGEWARFLGASLEAAGRSPIVFNLAACGYTSDQELLRLLRDGPGLQPHLVIAMSGVNDFGFLHASAAYPMTHRYQAYLASRIVELSPDLEAATLGIPWKCEPYTRWLRNVRLSRAIAADLGAAYVACLQPLLGVEPSLPTNAREKDWLRECVGRPCRQGSYIEEALNFYQAVRTALRTEGDAYDFVADLSDTFAGHDGVWADQRHPNAKGNQLLADRLFATLTTRKLL